MGNISLRRAKCRLISSSMGWESSGNIGAFPVNFSDAVFNDGILAGPYFTNRYGTRLNFVLAFIKCRYCGHDRLSPSWTNGSQTNTNQFINEQKIYMKLSFLGNILLLNFLLLAGISHSQNTNKDEDNRQSTQAEAYSTYFRCIKIYSGRYIKSSASISDIADAAYPGARSDIKT